MAAAEAKKILVHGDGYDITDITDITEEQTGLVALRVEWHNDVTISERHIANFLAELRAHAPPLVARFSRHDEHLEKYAKIYVAIADWLVFSERERREREKRRAAETLVALLTCIREMRLYHFIHLDIGNVHEIDVDITAFRIESIDQRDGTVRFILETPLGSVAAVAEQRFCNDDPYTTYMISYSPSRLLIKVPKVGQGDTLRALAVRQVAANVIADAGCRDKIFKRMFGAFYRAHDEEWITPVLEKKRKRAEGADGEDEEREMKKGRRDAI